MNIVIAGDLYVPNSLQNANLFCDQIVDLFAKGNYRMVNLEFPITDHKKSINKTGPNLCASEETAIPCLEQLNIDLVTLANNHIMDYGATGLKDTLSCLKSADINFVGAGKSKSEAEKPFILNIVNNVRSIRKVSEVCDKVIVIIHGGNEYFHYPRPRIVEQYRFYAIQDFDDEDFILFTDDDITVNKDWVVKYIEAIRKHPENSFFGGGMECEYEEDPSSDIKHLLPRSAIGASDSYFVNGNHLFLGCNWGCNSHFIKFAGYFNEELGPGTNSTGQESDMQRRLKSIGIQQIHIRNNYVYHYVPKEKSDWEFIRNRVKKNVSQKRKKKTSSLKRLKSEFGKFAGNIRKAPKNYISLMYTLKYTFIRFREFI